MTVAGATTNYSYDDASRLATVTPPSPASAVSYTWDNNGDLTGRGTDSFGWDYEDRLTSATVGGTNYAYTYRGDGLRNSAITGGVTKTFTWDLNAGLPVVLDDGARYIYGNGLVAQVAGANTYYYLSDGLGSTLKTTDASGNVVNAYTYDVYGKTTSSSGSQANDVQFAGQQSDPTGLQYLRARYYDPETGGFLSRDPLSTMPGWSGSPFAYAGGNPANFTDPTGLCRWWDVKCKVEGPVSSAAGAAGAVIGSVGDGAIQLVKLGGEYSLQFGANAAQYLLDHQDALQAVTSALLAASFYACLGGGLESAGAACLGAAVLFGATIGWEVSRALTSDDTPEALKVIQAVLALSKLVQLGQPGDIARDIWDDLGEPTHVQ